MLCPTRDRGLVWFTIINRGTNVAGFRTGQDKLLQRLVQQLQIAPEVPNALTPHASLNTAQELGTVSRNEILYKG